MKRDTILEVIEIKPWKIWVRTERVSVFVNPLGQDIRVGDELWCQGGRCYWRSAGAVEVSLQKVGHGGVSREEALYQQRVYS